MNKKTLGIALGIIAIGAGLMLVVLGVWQIREAQQGQSVLPQGEIEKAVAEAQKEFVSYQDPQTQMKIEYPKNWTVAPDQEGGGVSFSIFGGAVNLRFVSDDFTQSKEEMTLESYTQALMVQSKEKAAEQGVAIAPLSDSPAALAGTPGHQWQYTVTVSDVTGRGMQVWTLKDKRSYVFTYTAAGELYDAFTPIVQRMLVSIILP